MATAGRGIKIFNTVSKTQNSSYQILKFGKKQTRFPVYSKLKHHVENHRRIDTLLTHKIPSNRINRNIETSSINNVTAISDSTNGNLLTVFGKKLDLFRCHQPGGNMVFQPTWFSSTINRPQVKEETTVTSFRGSPLPRRGFHDTRSPSGKWISSSVGVQRGEAGGYKKQNFHETLYGNRRTVKKRARRKRNLPTVREKDVKRVKDKPADSSAIFTQSLKFARDLIFQMKELQMAPKRAVRKRISDFESEVVGMKTSNSTVTEPKERPSSAHLVPPKKEFTLGWRLNRKKEHVNSLKTDPRPRTNEIIKSTSVKSSDWKPSYRKGFDNDDSQSVDTKSGPKESGFKIKSSVERRSPPHLNVSYKNHINPDYSYGEYSRNKKIKTRKLSDKKNESAQRRDELQSAIEPPERMLTNKKTFINLREAESSASIKKRRYDEQVKRKQQFTYKDTPVIFKNLQKESRRDKFKESVLETFLNRNKVEYSDNREEMLDESKADTLPEKSAKEAAQTKEHSTKRSDKIDDTSITYIRKKNWTNQLDIINKNQGKELSYKVRSTNFHLRALKKHTNRNTVLGQGTGPHEIEAARDRLYPLRSFGEKASGMQPKNELSEMTVEQLYFAKMSKPYYEAYSSANDKKSYEDDTESIYTTNISYKELQKNRIPAFQPKQEKMKKKYFQRQDYVNMIKKYVEDNKTKAETLDTGGSRKAPFVNYFKDRCAIETSHLKYGNELNELDPMSSAGTVSSLSRVGRPINRLEQMKVDRNALKMPKYNFSQEILKHFVHRTNLNISEPSDSRPLINIAVPNIKHMNSLESS